jgi:hypothetical protein
MRTNKVERAPGAGRKPKGRFAGNVERISVRCTPEIKDQLELAAKQGGRSMPQEIQERLQRTFDDDADRYRDPAVWALRWMVEIAVLQFQRGGERNLPAWRTDPAEFEGFKSALDRILERLRPAGDASALLSKTAGHPNSPMARAKYVEWRIFETVERPKHIMDHYRSQRRGKHRDFPIGSETQRLQDRFVQAEDDRSEALRALGLK